MTGQKISRDDWIVFVNGVGVYTYSRVTKTPATPRSATMRTALVEMLDGPVYRRLVRETCPTSTLARARCDELNMEGATP